MASYSARLLGQDSPLLEPRGKYITPSLRRPVKADPAAPGTIIRISFAIETGLNIFMGTTLTVFPKWLLNSVVIEPATLTPTSISICQWLGAIILASSIPVGVVIPNTRGAIESRRLIYWTLLTGEGFLIPLFLYQAIWSANVGFTPKFLVVTAFLFLGHMIWRLYCLFVKPNWFGRYRDCLDD